VGGSFWALLAPWREPAAEMEIFLCALRGVSLRTLRLQAFPVSVNAFKGKSF
jgi:hypothetical protein